MSLTAEMPLPPADAYLVMEELLTERYFRHPQSESDLKSREVTVVGSDGVPTVWLIPVVRYDEVSALLNTHKDSGKIMSWRDSKNFGATR